MDRTLEDTFYILFTTRAFATGIPTTLAGTPVVSAYEDAGLTQITAGITLGVDHDGVTGLNLLTIVATAANGYGSGQDYSLVITTGTVGGVSVVGEVVGHFSLGLSAAAVDLANGTDGLGAIKAETALIVADTNELQTDWANGGRLDLILDAVLSMLDDARAEPGQGAPPVNPDAMTKLDYLYKDWRNKKEQTSTTYSLYDDAGTTVDQKATVSDNGTTATKGEIVSGP